MTHSETRLRDARALLAMVRSVHETEANLAEHNLEQIDASENLEAHVRYVRIISRRNQKIARINAALLLLENDCI